MFVNKYSHSLDTKGRVIIPAKYREELGEKFMITEGMDGCLYILPQKAFDILAEEIKSLPLNIKASRRMARQFFGSAADSELDKQGRALIPANLREYAGLEKDVVLVGAGERVEIWSKERLEASEGETNMDEVADLLAEMGLNL